MAPLTTVDKGADWILGKMAIPFKDEGRQSG